MKAIAYFESLPVSDPHCLQDVETTRPEPGAHDLLVEIKAIAVNPVDTKIRTRVSPESGLPKVLGWDAAGVVRGVGSAVSLFAPGDKVFYAGDLTRQGCNAEYQVVDERIVGKMPETLSFAEAAALPLTSLTAWELMFDRMGLPHKSEPDNKQPSNTLLIMGAAGGVGSIALQLAKNLTDSFVIASASRPESQRWVKDMGAKQVIDHSGDVLAQLQAIKEAEGRAPNYVLSLTHTEQHYKALAESMQPQGKFGLIDDPAEFDIGVFKRKSISLHWEFMYTRSMFQTEDMLRQHHILTEVAKLVDQGKIRSTLQTRLGSITAANLREAHRLLESQKTIGKIVLEGFA